MRGEVRRLIRDALLACFDEAGLRELAATRLGVELAHVAGGEDLAEIAWNLVTWAEQQGRLVELVRAASLDRPQAAAEWERLAGLAGSRPRERMQRMDYEGGAWERRIEGKIDELVTAVNRLDVRLSVVETQAKRPEQAFPPHLVWVAIGLLGGLVLLGTILSARLP